MRSLRLLALVLGFAATQAFASPTAPANGAEYVTLATPQPVQNAGKKVEVLEFFMYHCPHCNALEPELEAWIKRQGNNITVRRVHFPYSGPTDPEAHLYLTLEAMGKVDEMHAKVFHAFHVEKLRLMKDDVIFDWVGKNGIDRAKFIDMWNSFGVVTNLKRQRGIVDAYQIDSAPTLVIDGRYKTSPAIVEATTGSHDEAASMKQTIQVLDALVAKVMKDSAAKPAAAAPAKSAPASASASAKAASVKASAK